MRHSGFINSLVSKSEQKINIGDIKICIEDSLYISPETQEINSTREDVQSENCGFGSQNRT